MARPTADIRQKVAAFDLWLETSTIRMAHSRLRESFESPVSQGTVQNWFLEFKTADQVHGDRDKPFHWQSMTDHGIPRAAGDVLLRVSSVVGEFGDERSLLGESHSSFTFRDASWTWSVYLAVGANVSFSAPTPTQKGQVFQPPSTKGTRGNDLPLTFGDWLQFGLIYSQVERLKQVAGVDVDTAVLEHSLAYRPWESKKNLDRYSRAIGRKSMKPSDDGILQRLSDSLVPSYARTPFW